MSGRHSLQPRSTEREAGQPEERTPSTSRRGFPVLGSAGSPAQEAPTSAPGDAATIETRSASRPEHRRGLSSATRPWGVTPGRTLARRRHLFRRSVLVSPTAEARGAAAAEETSGPVAEDRLAYDLSRFVALEYNPVRLAQQLCVDHMSDPNVRPTLHAQAAQRIEEAAAEDEQVVPQPLHRIWRGSEGAEACLAPLSPPLLPNQERLIRRWIETFYDIELEEASSLVDILWDGTLLNEMIGQEPELPESPIEYEVVAKENTQKFLSRARQLGFTEDELFRVDDLWRLRNFPRVLRTIAALARKVDFENFADLASEDVSCPARTTWDGTDELDEEWQGDWLISNLANVVRHVCQRQSLNILVAGAMGSGKSSLINEVVGRFVARPNHNMRLHFTDEEVLAQDPVEGPTFVEDRMIHHEQLQRLHPRKPYRSEPVPGHEATTYHVKVLGVEVSLTELPSLEVVMSDEDEMAMLNTVLAGERDEVAEAIRNLSFDVILIAERVDLYRRVSCAGLLRELQNMLGAHMWERSIMVFTHGYSLPPEGLTFEENLARRIHLVQEVVRNVSGRSNVYIPITVVECSESCPRNEQGAKVLPNGSAFMDRLGMLCENVLVKHHTRPPMRVTLKRNRRKQLLRAAALAAGFFLLPNIFLDWL